MSRSLNIVFVFLAFSLFFSENTGKAFLYSCCLLNGFDRKNSVLNSALCMSIVSVMFDIYHSLFVGVSFVSLSIVVAMVKKFESILMNLPLLARIYYSFVIVCGAELANFVLTGLSGGRFNFYQHAVVVVKSVFFYYVLESLKEHVKR